MAKPVNPSADAWRAASHERLMTLTGLPTAAGREERVIAHVRRWAARHPGLRIDTDEWGNLMIQQPAGDPGHAASAAPPIILQAHLDHPAFIVHRPLDDRTLLAVFRGGVKREYFTDAPVRLHHDDGSTTPGQVVRFEEASPGHDLPAHDQDAPLLRITLHDAPARPVQRGDILTWDIGAPHLRDGLLHAPACDDLSAVSAAISAYDQWLTTPPEAAPKVPPQTAPQAHQGCPGPAARPDVRLLLTRAEEIGFIGTIGVCKAGGLPRDARLICLENSKSFAESPLGGGPIVRVGDYTSTFDPDLTYRVGQIAQSLAQSTLAAADQPGDAPTDTQDPFTFQRRLMAGGTCEASAYGAYGYVATCLCLPLGNYHNMNETTGLIDAEVISLADHDKLVTLLVHLMHRLDTPADTPSLRDRLDGLFERRAGVLPRQTP